MPRFTMPFVAAFDGNGSPMSGAKLYFYATGTTTPKNTYSDAALSTPNTNPVIADAAGRWPAIWMSDEAYRVVLKTSGDATVWTADDVRVADPAATDDLPDYLRLDGTTEPTADIPFGGNKLTDLGEPNDDADAATKAYVDGRTSFRGALARRTVASGGIFQDGVSSLAIWDSAAYDTSGFLTSGATRLTIPSGSGIERVRLTTQIFIDQAATSPGTIIIRRNGSSAFPEARRVHPIGSQFYSAETPVMEVNEGDYFEVYLAQTSGGTRSFGTSYDLHWFSIEVIN